MVGEIGIVAQSGVDLADVLQAQDGTGERPVLVFESSDLIAADLVDFLTGQPERRVRPDEVAVEVLAAVEVAQAGLAVIAADVGGRCERISVPTERRMD